LTWQVEPQFKKNLFYIAKETPANIQVLGGDFESLPNLISTGSLPRSIEDFPTDQYSESICVVCFVGSSELSQIGFEIGRLSNLVYENKSAPQYDWHRTTAYTCEELELVGVKYRSKLTKSQSRELTIFEVGDPNYSASVQFLSSNPCVALCVRGMNVYERVMKLFNIDSKGVSAVLPSKAFKSVTRFMSYDTRETYRLMKLFFDDVDLIADNRMRKTKNHTSSEFATRVVKVSKPSVLGSGSGKGNKSDSKQSGGVISVKLESVYSSILSGPPIVTCCLVVKPDACFRFLPYILRAIYRENFTILGLKLAELDEDDIKFLKSKDGATEGDNVGTSAGEGGGVLMRWCENGPVCLVALERPSAGGHCLTALLSLVITGGGHHSPYPHSPLDPSAAKRLCPKSWTAQFGRDRFENGFIVPQSFDQSVAFLDHFFPAGLPVHSKVWTKKMQPGNDEALNSFGSTKRTILLEKDRLSLSTTEKQTWLTNGNISSLSAAHCLLNQVNILILPYQLLSNNTTSVTSINRKSNDSVSEGTICQSIPPYVEVLAQLKSKGANLLGLRLLCVSTKQAKDILKLLGLAHDQQKLELLCGGPCLAVAFHRDNAVICFEQLLGSTYDKMSLFTKYSNLILRPTSISEANALLPMMFDKLLDNDYGTIVNAK